MEILKGHVALFLSKHIRLDNVEALEFPMGLFKKIIYELHANKPKKSVKDLGYLRGKI